MRLCGQKLVILIGGFARGGCERQAYLLARELRHKHGVDVAVWALIHDGDYRADFEAIGVPTKVLGFHPPDYSADGVQLVRIDAGRMMLRDPLFPLRWVVRLRRIVRHLRESKVDILLPFTTWPNVVSGLTYRRAGVKLCIWGERHSGGERVPGLERIAIRRYSHFAANSTAGVEFLARDMRVPYERISFVANGVELADTVSASSWRDRLGLGREQLLVTKVANLTSFKDHATLLRAWKLVQMSWGAGAAPVLALAGYRGDRYDECVQIVHDSGLASTVRFLGSIKDVPALVSASDLTVFSSHKEGMPNGILECMAAGKPVIASDLPGVRDALGTEAPDLLVPPGDSDRFASMLLDLMRDKRKRQVLGEANRARIQSEFSVPRMAERHLEIIETALSDSAIGDSGARVARGEPVVRRQGSVVSSLD